jgi:hypothetical protein
LREIAGENRGSRVALRAASSANAYYRYSHPVRNACIQAAHDHKEIAAVAKHIANFSLAGINFISKSAAK